MARYASGKDAYGISDRSGFRYRLRDMRKEWNGLLVGVDEFEPKHPQLQPSRVVADAQALRNPRPDRLENSDVKVIFPIFSLSTLKYESFISPAKGSIGTVTFGGDVTSGDITFSVSMSSATGSIGTVTFSGDVVTQTFAITVASYLGANKYYIDGVRQDTVSLSEGSAYRFDQSDSSNSGHPLRFSTTSDGTHGGGSQYTTGVSTNGTPGSSGAYTQITVASGAPTLYYYCTNHSGMGGQADNTP